MLDTRSLNKFCLNCPLQIRNGDICNYDLLARSKPKRPFRIMNFLGMLHFALQKLSFIFKFLLSFSLLGNFLDPLIGSDSKPKYVTTQLNHFYSLRGFEKNLHRDSYFNYPFLVVMKTKNRDGRHHSSNSHTDSLALCPSFYPLTLTALLQNLSFRTP